MKMKSIEEKKEDIALRLLGISKSKFFGSAIAASLFIFLFTLPIAFTKKAYYEALTLAIAAATYSLDKLLEKYERKKFVSLMFEESVLSIETKTKETGTIRIWVRKNKENWPPLTFAFELNNLIVNMGEISKGRQITPKSDFSIALEWNSLIVNMGEISEGQQIMLKKEFEKALNESDALDEILKDTTKKETAFQSLHKNGAAHPIDIEGSDLIPSLHEFFGVILQKN